MYPWGNYPTDKPLYPQRYNFAVFFWQCAIVLKMFFLFFFFFIMDHFSCAFICLVHPLKQLICAHKCLLCIPFYLQKEHAHQNNSSVSEKTPTSSQLKAVKLLPIHREVSCSNNLKQVCNIWIQNPSLGIQSKLCGCWKRSMGLCTLHGRNRGWELYMTRMKR